VILSGIYWLFRGVVFPKNNGLVHWWQNSKTRNSNMAPSERIGLETFTYIYLEKG